MSRGLPIVNHLSLVSAVRVSGTVPLKRLSPRLKYCRLVKLPKICGIVDVKRFLSKSRKVNFDSRFNDVGRVPIMHTHTTHTYAKRINK